MIAFASETKLPPVSGEVFPDKVLGKLEDSITPKLCALGDSGYHKLDRLTATCLNGIPTTSSGGTGGSEGVFVISATNRQDPFNLALHPRQLDSLVHPWHV